MKLFSLSLRLAEHSATVSRLLVLALVALAIGLSDQPVDPPWLTLVLSYALLSGLLPLLVPRLAWQWLVFAIALVDIAFVTALVRLLPSSELPVWVLYLFPIAGLAADGGLIVAAAAGASAAAYVLVASLYGGDLSSTAVWPALLLLSATGLILLVAKRGLVERREKGAWKEIAAAARFLGASWAPDEAAQSIARRACRLVRADAAWLWCYDEAGQLHPGPYVGPSAELPLLLGGLTRVPAGKLGRGTLPLAALGEPFVSLHGDVVTLRHGPEGLALLAVLWNRPPVDRTACRQRLRIFAPWAAEALAQARAISEAREELRREATLRQVAAALAATSDVAQARAAIVTGARAALGGAVSVVDTATGCIVDGDVVAADIVLPLLSFVNLGEPMGSAADREDDAPLRMAIADDLLLVVWATEVRPPAAAAHWLAQLGVVARTALDRCHAFARLEAEERRLRASIEAMPAPVAIYGPGGVLALANTAHSALGLGNAALANVDVGEVRDEETVAGSPPCILVRMMAPLSEGQGAVAVYRDITREREALRAKDELIATVGHELRSPLTSIFGYSQVMARQLGVVQRQLSQLNQLVGDFVDASRLDSNQLPLVRQAVDLRDLARSVAERFRGAHAGRRLRLELAEVPPVEGDPARLGQVIDNLLSNAAKYSPPDGEIVLGVMRCQGDVALYVLDHGEGIAPEHLPHLFERFYRAPGAHTKKAKGLGLGLSIVRDLVAAHGGQVWAESAGQGQGSRFWVSLPTMTGDEQASGTDLDLSWPSTAGHPERKGHGPQAAPEHRPLRLVPKIAPADAPGRRVE